MNFAHFPLGLISAAMWAGVSMAQEIRVVTYNVESDADTEIANVTADIAEIGPADIWGLQEVEGFNAIFAFRDAMNVDGRDMWFELGLSGGGDRLAIVYDRNKFDVLEGPEELTEVGGSRPPLRIKLVEKSTSQAFDVIVNHFNRSNASLRREQAASLRNWIAQSSEPVIVMGDFNFDLEAPDWANSGELNGNRAFDIFTAEPSPTTWIEHEPKKSTQCSDRYDSVLDFVFLGGAARSWGAQAELIFADEAEYCALESEGGADHLPISVNLSMSAPVPMGERNTEILAEISRMRGQLDALEAAIKAQEVR